MTDIPTTADSLALIESKNPAKWLCHHYRPQLEEALNYTMVRMGRHDLPLTFEPFAAAAVEEVLNDLATNAGNPNEAFLARAFRDAPETAISALTFAAQCKLLVGRRYGLVWLIPRRNHGRWEVQAQLGYKGLCTMGKRHPRVHALEAFLVYDGEEWDFNAGTGKMHHKVDWKVDRSDSKIIGGYGKCIITEEATHHAVIDAPLYWPMSVQEINKRRDNSDGFKKGGPHTPWKKWYPEMARKTLLIGLLNHGSVPLDMGTGGMLERDLEADTVREPAQLPRLTRQQEIRQDLGLDEKQEPFDTAEDAVAFIQACKTKEAMEAARGRWDWLQGTDVETVAQAYEDRLRELGEP